MEFYKEINQKRKKLNDDTFSLSNVQPIDNLDNWNNFVAKFKELINQKVESDPKESSFFISDEKLKGCWPKDKDDKMLDTEVASQLSDMVLGIDISRNIDNDKFYVNVTHRSNYQDKKHDLFNWLTVVCFSIILLITNSNSLPAFVIAVIFGGIFSVLTFNMFKGDILKFRYLRKLKKKVLFQRKGEKYVQY